MSFLAEISYLATFRYKFIIAKQIFKIFENSFDLPPWPMCTAVADVAIKQHIVYRSVLKWLFYTNKKYRKN